MQNTLRGSNSRSLAYATNSLLAALFLLALTIQTAHAQTFTVLHNFSGSDGISPESALIMDSSGNLYGTTNNGGYTGNTTCLNVGGCGTIFELDSTGKLTTLYSFQGTSDGYNPYESVMRIGTTIFGTNTYGGTGTCNTTVACGTFYELTSTGKLKVLNTFDGTNGSTPPPGRLNLDGKGNAFGTTAYQGVNGQGTVYKISGSGALSTIYSFGNEPDGNVPMAGLVIADKGQVIYGMTEYGGNCPYGSIEGSGCGTVYKLASGKETQLYVFSGSTDGANPTEDLIADSSGNLYGTTTSGGDVNCTLTTPNLPQHGARNPWSLPLMEQSPPGCGVVFKVNASTGAETVLYSFTGSTDGGFPTAGVILDSSGNLYGTTISGGNLSCDGGLGCGVVFKLSPSGQLTVLHTFSGSDGVSPGWGSLLMDKSGNLYGTTGAGGSFNDGVVFKITP
jgi:uncharacterized repeat protein (TIGR03803 family)